MEGKTSYIVHGLCHWVLLQTLVLVNSAVSRLSCIVFFCLPRFNLILPLSEISYHIVNRERFWSVSQQTRSWLLGEPGTYRTRSYFSYESNHELRHVVFFFLKNYSIKIYMTFRVLYMCLIYLVHPNFSVFTSYTSWLLSSMFP